MRLCRKVPRTRYPTYPLREVSSAFAARALACVLTRATISTTIVVSVNIIDAQKNGAPKRIIKKECSLKQKQKVGSELAERHVK